MYSIAYLLIPKLFSAIAYAAPQIGVDEKGPVSPPPLQYQLKQTLRFTNAHQILNCGRGDIPLTTLCTDNAYTCDFTTFELISPAAKIEQCSYVSTSFRFPRSIP